MRLLKDIIYGVRIENVIGSTNVAIEDIAYDSRQVMKFGMFVATRVLRLMDINSLILLSIKVQ